MGATAPDADLLAGVGETREAGETSVTEYLYKRGITLHRTTATDDQMMAVLAKELSFRQVKLPKFPPKGCINWLDEIISGIKAKSEEVLLSMSKLGKDAITNGCNYLDSTNGWFKGIYPVINAKIKDVLSAIPSLPNTEVSNIENEKNNLVRAGRQMTKPKSVMTCLKSHRIILLYFLNGIHSMGRLSMRHFRRHVVLRQKKNCTFSAICVDWMANCLTKAINLPLL